VQFCTSTTLILRDNGGSHDTGPRCACDNHRTPLGGRRIVIDRAGRSIAIGMFVIVLVLAIMAAARHFAMTRNWIARVRIPARPLSHRGLRGSVEIQFPIHGAAPEHRAGVALIYRFGDERVVAKY
jgi:hypothetical protein